MAKREESSWTALFGRYRLSNRSLDQNDLRKLSLWQGTSLGFGLFIVSRPPLLSAIMSAVTQQVNRCTTPNSRSHFSALLQFLGAKHHATIPLKLVLKSLLGLESVGSLVFFI